MLLTKFDPMRDLREFEERFTSAMRLPDIRSELSNVSGFSPAVNTREGEYAYHVEVDLPGVKKEDIHVDLQDNVLTISGERKTREEVKETEYYKLESSYGKLQRSFTLPENTDAENIEANAEDGVLEVVIPKIEKSKKSKKITIR